jgi:GGDEF domain-containing protein
MLSPEVFIWSALFGSLITFVLLATAPVVAAPRSLANWYHVTFVLLIGGALVVNTGLLHALWDLPGDRAQDWLRSFIGPLAAGVSLYYLGQWMGGIREDPLIHRITQLGGLLLCICAGLLALVALMLPPMFLHDLLWVTAAVNLLGALLAVLVSVRGAALGDPLARGMLLACVALTLMTVGIYAYSLQLPGVGFGIRALTSLTALVFFGVATALVDRRNRDNRRLARLSRAADPTVEPATGLPIGARLVSELEHMFWRTQRLNHQCAVMCLYLRNLYELNQDLGTTAEYQILVAIAARIRRAAGFRCVVGMYHPRCFVVVLDVDRLRQPPELALRRLSAFACEPMTVRWGDAEPRKFHPEVGLAMTVTDAADATPLEVLNATEAAAQHAAPARPESQVETML